MTHSLAQLYVHITFHKKYYAPDIQKKDKDEIYTFMGGLIKENQSIPIIINGVENHVHILCSLSKNVALADLMEDIKRRSSLWIKDLNSYYKNFYWQGGYAGFSVSPSVLKRTIKYIKNQERHHKKHTYKDEYEAFLKEYQIEYDEKYLWDH